MGTTETVVDRLRRVIERREQEIAALREALDRISNAPASADTSMMRVTALDALGRRESGMSDVLFRGCR